MPSKPLFTAIAALPAAGLSRLSPVDLWRFSQLSRKAQAAILELPIADRPAFLMAMQMIGDDLARSPQARLLMVRLAVETRDARTLQPLMLDTDPSVRAAAGWGLAEIQGSRKRRHHAKAMQEAQVFGKKWRTGAARIPFQGFRQGPPLAV
jgi:hypothetical protein